MKHMHISQLDLNLLKIAASLYKSRNVSKSAAELRMTQSAVSHALARLRDQLQDPLFVRTSKGVAPTDYARKVETEILDIVHRVELLLSQKEEFDPATTKSRIVISSTDYFEVTVLAKLQKVLSREAPHLQISLRPTVGTLPKRELEEGSVDLAIAGFYRDLPESFYQSKLFVDQFSCAIGKEHPLYGSKSMSMAEFKKCRHALITLQGDFRDPTGRGREFVYGTYSFTGMAWILQSAEVVLTAPNRLLAAYQEFFPIRVWPSPLEHKPIDIRMVWHAQTHEDPLRLWIRNKIKEICRE